MSTRRLPGWCAEPTLRLTREKTNLFLSLCDLLSIFALQHTFRSHFFMLTSNISTHVATLLCSRDKHLRLGTSVPPLSSFESQRSNAD